MTARRVLIAGMATAMLTLAPAGAWTPPKLAPLPEMPKQGPAKHINKVIDLWLKGQPVYYTSVEGRDLNPYEAGKKMAATKADYINYGMESGPLDFQGLSEFMRGLADGGPTKDGHRTPAVIVELPIPGTADAMRANAWMIQQAIAQGVHGIMLTNAEDPEAVKLMIEASRYPFAPAVKGLRQGWHGNGSQNYAAKIWGITPAQYMQVADVWPLNPAGELIFGVKIENPRADANVEKVLAVPGVSFVEHGPGDNSFYFTGRPGSYQGSAADTPQMMAVEAKVREEAKKNNLHFLHGCSESNVEEMIKSGVMICTGGETPAADKGRAFTKRTDPW